MEYPELPQGLPEAFEQFRTMLACHEGARGAEAVEAMLAFAEYAGFDCDRMDALNRLLDEALGDVEPCWGGGVLFGVLLRELAVNIASPGP